MKLGCSSREMMRTQSAALGMLLMLIISTSSAGCIGLVMQREIMEDLREEPTTIEAFPYNGRKVGVTVGVAGEWIELVEK